MMRSNKNFEGAEKDERPVFVISAIRIHFGGALEVVNDFLLYLNNNRSDKFRFVVLVCNKKLYAEVPNLEMREFKLSRKSVFFRLWMEYIGFYFLSLKMKPEI